MTYISGPTSTTFPCAYYVFVCFLLSHIAFVLFSFHPFPITDSEFACFSPLISELALGILSCIFKTVEIFFILLCVSEKFI